MTSSGMTAAFDMTLQPQHYGSSLVNVWLLLMNSYMQSKIRREGVNKDPERIILKAYDHM